MDGRLHVRNLALSTTEDDLRSLFAEVGDVLDVRIIHDRESGDSRGFAFLTMSALSEADTAVSRLNDRLLNGFKLRVTLRQPRAVRGFGAA